MSLHIAAKTFSGLLTSDAIPPLLRVYEIPGATPLITTGPFGDFLFQKLQGTQKDVSIWYTNYLPVQKENFLFSSTTSDLFLQFNLGKGFTFDQEGLGERELHQGHFNLFNVPSLHTRMTMHKGAVYCTFSISFSFSILAQLIAHNPSLREFFAKVTDVQPAILCGVNQVTTSKMDEIIGEILHSDPKSLLHPVFLDIKVQELLVAVIDKVTNHPTGASEKIRDSEVERICAAKKALLENIQAPLSLPALSKLTGLNIKKIKAGFKQLYERTPFDLLLSVRMETAQTLLEAKEMSVGDIAETVGYTCIQSFSKAFKTYFGYRPMAYRNKTDDLKVVPLRTKKSPDRTTGTA